MDLLFNLISMINVVLDDNSNNNEIFQNFWLSKILNVRFLHFSYLEILACLIVENSAWFEVLKMISFFIYE
jgi:hypothetical protein